MWHNLRGVGRLVRCGLLLGRSALGNPRNRYWYSFLVAKMSKYDRLVKSLSAKGAEDPKGLAAYIGRKKLGKAEFQRRAAAGRKAAA